MRNYIVRYPGKKDGVIVLASHYETNYPLKDINFVGANDGACTSALLIALGEYLRAHPPRGLLRLAGLRRRRRSHPGVVAPPTPSTAPATSPPSGAATAPSKKSRPSSSPT